MPRVPATMTVPRFVGGGRIETVEKPVSEPGLGQLLVQIRANAFRGPERSPSWSGMEVTPGHEAAGTVVAVDPGTTKSLGTSGGIYLKGVIEP